MKPNKIASIIAWCVSVWFTAVFVYNASELGYVLTSVIAFAVQFCFTIAERPLWRWVFRRKGAVPALAALFITLCDGMVNAAGIFPSIPRLARTNVGLMLIGTFDLNPRIDTYSAFAIALFIGTVVAGLAEYLWELDTDATANVTR